MVVVCLIAQVKFPERHSWDNPNKLITFRVLKQPFELYKPNQIYAT